MPSLTPLFLHEREHGVLWLPVCFAIGILCYFSLKQEPPVWPAGLVLAVSFSTAILCRQRLLVLAISLALLFASAGFLTVHLRSLWLFSPVLSHPTGIIPLEGRVVEIFPLTQGKRIIFDQLTSPAMPVYALPVKARLVVRTHSDGIYIGDRVGFRAALSPPPPPVLPGGYDFARTSYFKQIGAVGYTVTSLHLLERATHQSIRQRIYNFRIAMAEHMTASMGNDTGAIAAALILGMDNAIDRHILEDMRASGLSHILSVSGMHLSLVAALFFFLVRFLLVLCSESLALRYDSKKLAAIVAIIGTFGYYLVSGMQVAAFRSFLMTSMVIIAILLDRTATPLRSIAWAAFIILLLQPESILDPSFQMSFAAVTALIAAYDLNRSTFEFLLVHRLSGKLLTYIMGIISSSLIAGTATAPFAIYHFNQYANYSILANLVAVPLTSFIVMPLAVLAFFLYPLEWDGRALTLMHYGIEGVVAIAHWVAELPHAVKLIPFMPLSSLMLIILGGLFLCLGRGNIIRLFGTAPILLAIAMMVASPKPDILIDGKGALFAVRNSNGELIVSSKRHNRYARTMWLKQNGQIEAENFQKPTHKHSLNPVDCDEDTCFYLLHEQLAVFAFTPAGLNAACTHHVAMLINLTDTPSTCSAPFMLDSQELHNNGTHMLFVKQDSVEVTSVGETRGKRLWSGYY